jgi:hypothetical protein
VQEDLYEEDMPKKVRATAMIAQLFRNTENFEHLLSHETLLQVGHVCGLLVLAQLGHMMAAHGDHLAGTTTVMIGTLG